MASVAAMTAGIFAAMPILVEAVAWMAGRFDVLATCLSAWSVADIDVVHLPGEPAPFE